MGTRFLMNPKETVRDGYERVADAYLADNYYGACMYWSHYDAPTNLSLLHRAGFEVLWSAIIGDSLGGEAATGGHLFVMGRKAGELSSGV